MLLNPQLRQVVEAFTQVRQLTLQRRHWWLVLLEYCPSGQSTEQMVVE
jgi:hypothetical protein